MIVRFRNFLSAPTGDWRDYGKSTNSQNILREFGLLDKVETLINYLDARNKLAHPETINPVLFQVLEEPFSSYVADAFRLLKKYEK